ncbi:MerR family transcriptional regulator [Lactovum odontotermitis]
MNIKEVTKMTGLTSRTLRVWENAGLLAPKRGENTYREYEPSDLTKIFYIMNLRALDMPLSAIQEVLSRTMDEQSALSEHLFRLRQEQQRLSDLIDSLTKKLEKGDFQMSEKDFEQLKKLRVQENEEKYGQEVRQKYGDEAADRANEKYLERTQGEMNWDEDTHQRIVDLLNAAFPEKDETMAREAVELHAQWLSYHLSQPITAEMHRGFAQMYVDDSRFRKNYDRDFDGVAEFFRDAVVKYYTE